MACVAKGCAGTVAIGDRCAGHAETSDLERFLEGLAPEQSIDATKAQLDGPRTAKLLATGRAVVLTGATITGPVRCYKKDIRGLNLNDARLDGDLLLFQCLLTDHAWLRNATFIGDFDCSGSEFRAGATATHTTFQQVASFKHCRWSASGAHPSGATFDDASFWGAAYFGHALFDIAGSFQRTAFGTHLELDHATFAANARFTAAHVGGHLSANDAAFRGSAHFDQMYNAKHVSFRNATFATGPWVDSTTFIGGLTCDGAALQSPGVLGDINVYGPCSFRRTTFRAPLRVRIESPSVDLDGAQFHEGATIGIRESVFAGRPPVVHLSDLQLHGPLRIESNPRLDSACEERRSATIEANASGEFADAPSTHTGLRPQAMNVDATDLSYVTLARLDLSVCGFQGAHRLDELRIEGSPDGFPRSPRSWRWTDRRIIADERIWRIGHRRDAAWARPETGHSYRGPGYWQHGRVAPGPREMAETYRALRKGREDQKDEPGAADFYYGEMEMRRHSADLRISTLRDLRRLGEKTLLTLYWLLSGYGMRASRSLLALTIAVLLFAVAFTHLGFTNPADPIPDPAEPTPPADEPPARDARTPLLTWEAVAYSLGTASAVFGGPDAALTTTGQFLHIALRIIGPVLLGLAILAVRGRTKR